jgi:hypothetical protein
MGSHRRMHRRSELRPGSRLLAALLPAAVLLGCAGPAELVREGRLPEAWREVCGREPEDGPSPENLLFPEERRAFREALWAATEARLSASVLSRQALHERLGGAVFPRDAFLLVFHLEASSHVGTGIDVSPRLVLGGVTHESYSRRDLWTLANVEPPRPASFGSYNLAGALLDAVVAGLTLGTVDLEARGTKELLPSVSPGEPGTGTPLQEDVLFQLMDQEAQCSIIHPAQLGRPCDAFVVLASGKPDDPDYEPVSVDDAPTKSAEDALIVRVEHQDDRVSDAGCSLAYELVFPLPEGPDVESRVAALFARGPVSLGGKKVSSP